MTEIEQMYFIKRNFFRRTAQSLKASLPKEVHPQIPAMLHACIERFPSLLKQFEIHACHFDFQQIENNSLFWATKKGRREKNRLAYFYFEGIQYGIGLMKCVVSAYHADTKQPQDITRLTLLAILGTEELYQRLSESYLRDYFPPEFKKYQRKAVLQAICRRGTKTGIKQKEKLAYDMLTEGLAEGVLLSAKAAR